MKNTRKPAGRRDRPEKPDFNKDKPSRDGAKPGYRGKPDIRKKRESDEGARPVRPYRPEGDDPKRKSFSGDRDKTREKPEYRGKPDIRKRREPDEGERPARSPKPEGDKYRRESYSSYREKAREKPEYRGKPDIRKKSDSDEGERAARTVKPEGDTFKRKSFPEERGASERPIKGEFSKERSRDYRERDDRASRNEREEFGRTKPFKERGKTERPEKPEYKKTRPERPVERYSDRPKEREKPSYSAGKGERRNFPLKKQSTEPGLIRLNKFIADAGICSRREADLLITAGVVKVNGIVVTELGTKVSPADKVQYADQTLNREKLRYVLLNKPKGFITTTDDPQERKTVMNLVAKACKERIYPVGRLDRNTTGLLLFTNDGELTKKLLHPRHGVRKVYHVVLDKPVLKKDMVKIAAGIELDDGNIKVDAIDYSGEAKDKKQVGVELHSGKNRVVRRIFEQLGYDVVRLDRIAFAGLTKKNLPRGEWRLLDDKEISFLKMLS